MQKYNFRTNLGSLIMQSSIKVLLAAPLPPPDHGGIITWTRIVRRGLAARPDVELMIVDTTARYRSVTNHSRVARLLGGSTQALRDIYRLYRRLKVDRPDVLHLCTSGGPATLKDFLVLQMAKCYGVPSVIHYHMGCLPKIIAQGGIERQLTLRTMALASAVIPLDRESEACVRAALPNQQIEKLPNMVEIDRLDEIRREKLPPSPSEGRFGIVFAGHVVPAKGLREMVSACSRLHDVPLALDVIGPADPAFQTELEQIAAEQNDDGWLRFHGPVDHDNAVRHIAQADLFVLPSYSEGMPNVVLEAMACGRAILGAAVGAIPEMLDIGGPRECGVCVPPQDTDALAEAIRRLIRRPEYRLDLGRKARQLAEERYAMPVGCRKLLDLWQFISGCSGSSSHDAKYVSRAA